MDISVVIPVKNGAHLISTQLKMLLSQVSDAESEIIVADNGSSDDTVDVVRSFQGGGLRLRVVDASDSPGANAARNAGVRAAHGRVILLTDADDAVHDGWIQAYWEAFQAGASTAGGALVRMLEDKTILSRESRIYRSQIGRCDYANATNCAFTREVFNQVGGFDETLIGTADEVEFFVRTQKAGYSMTLVPDAVVDKVQHTDLATAFQQYLNFGRGEALLAVKHRPRMVIPVALLAGLQTGVWMIAWATVGRTKQFKRTATTSLAFNLGMALEAVRSRSQMLHQPR